MTDNEFRSEGETRKASGCSTLIKAGMVVFGFIVVLQIFGALSEYFGTTATLCCSGLIVMGLAIFMVRRNRKAGVSEPEDLREDDSWAFLDEGKRLLSQKKREQAVAAYLQAYQGRSPQIRNLALKALEELGEVEIF